jgi:hypothetical protein
MTSSAEYRHRTSDLWEASFLWAQGCPLSHTERDGERVWFCFPDIDGVEDLLRDYQLGNALVNPLLHRQGYFQMRDAMSRELRDARAR